MEEPIKPTGYAAFADDLKRRSTSELIELARGVRELLDGSGWASVQQILGRKRNIVVESLVHTPRVLEQAHYARQTGIASGLDLQKRAAEAIVYAAAVREKEEQAKLDAKSKES